MRTDETEGLFGSDSQNTVFRLVQGQFSLDAVWAGVRAVREWKRLGRLTEKQEPKLAELLKLNLRTVRAYLLKEDFQLLWDCRSPTQANKFLKRWCRRATRSRIKPMQKVAKMLRKHRPLLLNWFRTGRAFSSGAVEGMNNKAKVALRKAYGFRSYKSYELALYHTLADLPQHSLAHRFC